MPKLLFLFISLVALTLPVMAYTLTVMMGSLL